MQPLRGPTVVSLEHAIAAPYATRQLFGLGARVIKIERPGSGDFARGYDTRVRGLASHFVWTNRSKESLTLDVKHPQAAQILQRLVLKKTDCWCRTWAPSAAVRLGLGYEVLGAAKPGLIVCDISGYGDDPVHPGPYRDKKAYDLLIQSEAGFKGAATTRARARPTLRRQRQSHGRAHGLATDHRGQLQVLDQRTDAGARWAGRSVRCPYCCRPEAGTKARAGTQCRRWKSTATPSWPSWAGDAASIAALRAAGTI